MKDTEILHLKKWDKEDTIRIEILHEGEIYRGTLKNQNHYSFSKLRGETKWKE